MNYYPFHLGDYAAHTAHLEPMEDLAYRRMLDKYYLREGSLPPNPADVARLVRMRQQIAEVEAVLKEFFTLTSEGWVHRRCEQEIEAFQERQAGSEQREASETERMRRHRERRAEMFEALRAVDFVPPWNVQMKELQRLYNEHVTQASAKPETKPETPATPPATHLQRCSSVAPATPATAKPEPEPEPKPEPEPINTHRARDRRISAKTSRAVCVSEPAAVEPPRHTEVIPIADSPDPQVSPTQAGSICKAIKAEGIGDVNPGHPTLAELIKAGVQEIEFVGAAAKAAASGKPNFAYVLGIVTNTRKQAKALEGQLHTGALPMPFAIATGQVNKQEALEARNLQIANAWAEKMRAQQAAQGASHAAV